MFFLWIPTINSNLWIISNYRMNFLYRIIVYDYWKISFRDFNLTLVYLGLLLRDFCQRLWFPIFESWTCIVLESLGLERVSDSSQLSHRAMADTAIVLPHFLTGKLLLQSKGLGSSNTRHFTSTRPSHLQSTQGILVRTLVRLSVHPTYLCKLIFCNIYA